LATARTPAGRGGGERERGGHSCVNRTRTQPPSTPPPYPSCTSKMRLDRLAWELILATVLMGGGAEKVKGQGETGVYSNLTLSGVRIRRCCSFVENRLGSRYGGGV
jgi:hypothetical protein